MTRPGAERAKFAEPQMTLFHIVLCGPRVASEAMPAGRDGTGPGGDANLDAGRDHSDAGDRGAGSFADGGRRGDVAVTHRQASNQREIYCVPQGLVFRPGEYDSQDDPYKSKHK